MKYLVVILVFFIFSTTSALAQSSTTKLVGAYQGAPGSFNSRIFGGCGTKGCGWPEHLAVHPTLGKYDNGTDTYINWSLDKMADLGINFVILDESNGIHLTVPPLESDLLHYMDVVDVRIAQGITTPKVTLMSPFADTGADANWIWNNLVTKNGSPRPGWFMLNSKPLWGIYSVRPFTTAFTDSRYTLRYIANSQGNDCHQAQLNTGSVWCWGTRNENGPIYSSNSKEVTIQNGFDDSVACLDYWDRANDPSCFIHDGFTGDYYTAQWNAAIAFNPEIIVITSFGGGSQVEGGQIEQRTDFSPPTLYEDITKEKILSWKGHIIDIFDYNNLVASFGHPYTIFDYNQLVANFGKTN